MPRTKQTAAKSTGALAPNMPLPTANAALPSLTTNSDATIIGVESNVSCGRKRQNKEISNVWPWVNVDLLHLRRQRAKQALQLLRQSAMHDMRSIA
jgi:hypothetical protein